VVKELRFPHGGRNVKSRIVTIHDVADEAGVSVATASRVLNRNGYYSQAAERRVETSARQLGYRVHGVARSLKRQQSNMIGLIIADILNPFYATLADGVLSRASELGYKTILSATSEDAATEHEYIQVLLEERVAGILAVPTSDSGEYWKEAVDFGIPVVFVDRELSPSLNVDSVLVDNERGGREATRCLLGLGHSRIGIINGPVSLMTGRHRLEGYRKAHAEAGVPTDQDLIELVSFKGQHGYEATKRLLALPAPPTAIFAANNVLGEGAFFAIKERGLSIPEDISLVMFDDVPWCRLMVPPVSVVKQPAFDVGYQGMEMLSRRLGSRRDRMKTDAQRLVLPTELLVRGSCARPR
jgi:LacI family transcriptional regulator